MPQKAKPTIYLETSVISAYFDFWKAAPEQKRLTRQFWQIVLPKHQAVISDAVMAELSNARIEWAKKFKQLVNSFDILPFNQESINLAKKYVKAGIIPKSYQEDAIHLAIACLQKCDYLATWNSEHLVRPYKLRQIYNFNKKFNLHFPILIKPVYFLENN